MTGRVQRFEKRLREHLHVAREHDQIDALGLEQLELAALLLVLGRGGHREDPVRDAELPGERGVIGMVAHDQRDLAGELPRAMAQQQVVEAMVVARNEDRDALDRVRPGEAPGHREALARLRAMAPESERRSVCSSRRSKRMRWKNCPASGSVC